LGDSSRYALVGTVSDGSPAYGYTGPVLSEDTWTYVVMVFDGTQDTNEGRLSLYVNGEAQEVTFGGTIPAATPDFFKATGVGFGGNIGSCVDCDGWDGSIDEVRISGTARSAGWIQTEYNNQSAPGNFYTVGEENSQGPAISGIIPAAGPAGTVVRIDGSHFGPGPSGGTVTFNGVAAATTGWSESSIMAMVPALAAGPAAVTVTVDGTTSPAALFTVTTTALTITGLSPSSGPVGTAVTIAGSGFGTSQGGSAVTFHGVSAETATSWSDSSITVAVPAGASTGEVVVTVGGAASNGVVFTVLPPAPTLTSVSPASGTRGAVVAVTLTGANFAAGATVATSNPGITVSDVAVTSATQIAATFTIGTGANLGVSNVTVTTSGGTSGAVGFRVSGQAPASITATGGTPQSVGFYSAFVPLVATVKDAAGNPVAGAAVTFQAPEDGSGCWFQTVGASVLRSGLRTTAGPRPRSLGGPVYAASVATDANGTAASPPCVAEPTAGDFTVTATVDGAASPAVFQLTNTYPAATLTSVTPASGAQGTSVGVILGGYLFAPGATVAVSNPGIAVSGVTVVNDSKITATFTIAASAAAGAADVTVTTSSGTSNAVSFTVTRAAGPSITSLSVTSGVVGTPVTISGNGFGATQSDSTVTFNGVSAGVAASWSDSSIRVNVPAGGGTGNVVVTVGGAASNGVGFTVTSGPGVTSIWPASGPVGTVVTITGSGFGGSQGGSTVEFGGASAGTAPYWSDTSITAVVPAGAMTGAWWCG